jgi:CheY-like chemotaxis protein
MMENIPCFLYVEDDMLSRKVMFTLLTKVMNFPDVIIFEDSNDFLQRIQTLPFLPTVIFLDVQIGPLDGYEMLQVLRNIEEYRDAKIIALTANVMSNDVERLKRVGFSGLIGKPIIKQAFPELLEKILAGEEVWFVP